MDRVTDMPIKKNQNNLTIPFINTKKYIGQEPPYLMRQICVLHWEEIETKNSRATHHF